MPEMELERRGADRPIAALPPGTHSERVVEVFVQVAKAEAGCSICGRVTPKGSSRITLKVKMPNVYDEDARSHPPKRAYQRYHFHPACLTKPMGSEIKRGAFDCWDCGAMKPLAANNQPDHMAAVELGWAYAFTTTRFASAPLCPKCVAKPKWRKCDNCQVYFPQWMVNVGTYETRRRRAGGFSFEAPDEPVIDHGEWCSYCADRYDVPTKALTKQSAEEFEELRRQIAERGIFDE